MNLNLKKKKSEKLLPESHYKTFFRCASTWTVLLATLPNRHFVAETTVFNFLFKIIRLGKRMNFLDELPLNNKNKIKEPVGKKRFQLQWSQ